MPYKLQRVLTEAFCFLFRDICISKCRLKHDYSRHSNQPVFMLYSTVKVYDVPHDGTEVYRPIAPKILVLLEIFI